MTKILAIVSILFFLAPGLIYAQSTTPTLSPASSGNRNTLFLLGSPQNGEVYFTRFAKRSAALLKRIKKINDRIEKRISKLNINASSLKKINNQTEKLNSEISDLQKSLTDWDESWRKIKTSKNKKDYLDFKTSLTAFIAKSEKIMADQKTLLKDLKKFKPAAGSDLN